MREFEPYQDYQRTQVFGALDGVRFLCIAAVLWHHSPIHGQFENAMQIWARGFVGVNFFFVLSGFLITTLLLREEARFGRFSLRNFYIRRILRIFPVYFLVVFASASYWVVIKGQDQFLSSVPYYIFFLSNMVKSHLPLLQPTWSLAVEEQYYIIWPLLLATLPVVGRLRALFLIGLIALCVLSSVGALAFLGVRPIETETAVWAFSVTGYSAILIGSLTALVLHTERGFKVLYRLFGFAGAPLVAFAALFVVLDQTPGIMRGWPDFAMHLVMASCLITVVVREDHILRSVLMFKPIARVGQVSYGLYLYHLIGLHFGLEIGARLGFTGLSENWAAMIVYVGLSFVMAEVSFRTYERYFLSLKGRMTQSLPPP